MKVKLPKFNINKKNLIVCAAIGLIAAAICLNWIFFSGEDNIADSYAGENFNGSVPLGQSSFVENTSSENAPSNEDNYFALTQISRQRARDEAMEVLQVVIDDENALQEIRDEAAANISEIASQIESEANIETLIVAKGFEECVAVLGDSTANIVVKSNGLLPNEIAQIKEIVCEQAGLSPTNVKIIEKTS